MLAAGQVLAERFTVDSLLGRGGMGSVFVAQDALVGEPVAIKLIHSTNSPAVLEELRVARRVSHPNLCRLHDAGECALGGQQQVFISMELLSGETLAERLRRRPRLTATEAGGFVREIVSAVAALHQAGVVHADLKPSNVMIAEGDTGPRAVVTDFGLSHFARESPAPAGPAVAGTPEYMSPEIRSGGSASPATDVYALGLIIAQTMAGLDIHQILDEAGRLTVPARAALRDAGPEWLRVTERSLNPDSAGRYASAGEMHSALTCRRPLWRRWPLWAAAAALCGAAGFTAWFLLAAPTSDVTVLPFENSTGDSKLAYLSESVPASLRQSLSRVPGLRVAPWSSARPNRGLHPDSADVRKRLHARSYVTGELTQQGPDLALAVELVDSSSGETRWRRTYARPATMPFDIEAALLTDIAPQLTPKSAEPGTPAKIQDRAAYDLYLRGLYEMNRYSPTSMESAVSLFTQALDRQPSYALAHAALADAYQLDAVMFESSPSRLLGLAQAESQRALELDPGLSEAHSVYGITLSELNYNWAAAERELRLALRLDPRNALAHSYLAGGVLLPQKRYLEALLEASRAVDLEPDQPEHKVRMVLVLYVARRFDTILTRLEGARAIQKGMDPVVLGIKALALAGSGRNQEALAALESAPPMADSAETLPGPRYFPVVVRGYIYAALGRRAEAEETARRLLAAPNPASDQSCGLAAIYGRLGNMDRAFELLETCYVNRGLVMRYLNGDFRFDVLRGEPRFQALLKRMGMPE